MVKTYINMVNFKMLWFDLLEFFTVLRFSGFSG
jgi:hypothetical protein